MGEYVFYKNFEQTLNRLKHFVSLGVKDDLDRAGIIQAFEFTFEQCWKAIQKKAKEEGVNLNSPKQAFVWAMGQGWIESEDESLWLDILSDRNLTTHTYQEDMAVDVSNNVVNRYLPAFEKIMNKMKS